MRIDNLLPRQDNCIQCPASPPPCNCSSNQDCFQINRDCNTCSQTKCVDRATSSGSSATSPGVSKGALAGGIIGALFFFLIIAVVLFLWYRRRSHLVIKQSALPGIKEVPASAETVLNRPDPAEKPSTPAQVNSVRVFPVPLANTGNPDPEFQHGTMRASAINSTQTQFSNPFEDSQSIQTTGTEGTNVIPIALVHPQSLRTESSQNTLSTSSSQPSRPPRSPELDINLGHTNVSNGSIRSRNYSPSTRSGSRNSYTSNASYSSDFLNEAPVIVTPTRTAVRQVLGIVKAEVISAASSSDGGLKPPSSRSAKSPLATSSFGPDDIVAEDDENQEGNNPFSDNDKQSTPAAYGGSASLGTSSFVHAGARSEQGSIASDLISQPPKLPWKSSHQSTPSIGTQAGSVIDIGNATRVNLSADGSANGHPRYRTTVARLVNPASLQEQQQRGVPGHTQTQAQTQGSDKSRRTSGSSVVSAASRAYSILESFPFVPPSPISDRPVRSPPRSPQTQQSFTSNASSPLSQHTFNATTAPPLPQGTESVRSTEKLTDKKDEDLPTPPNRRALALSTVSTASSGLGSFPFHIETGSMPESNASPSVPTNGRQRASLDTLALTSDLSSYPLGFDRDSVQVPAVPALPKKY
ncbi:hypothetical protein AX15_004518 [Amanita polypyramis BW_CC]|nr:hypothetical protein AX15_004518 [Amanita polypyramis BW_CC]